MMYTYSFELDETDRKFLEAYAEYLANPVIYTHEEMHRRLALTA